jgi:hypothetical protein
MRAIVTCAAVAAQIFEVADRLPLQVAQAALIKYGFMTPEKIGPLAIDDSACKREFFGQTAQDCT